MIIGSGLLARAFSPYFEFSTTVCVYAAGVSNSTCTDQREFDREEERLKAALSEHGTRELFIYFGTCSANGPPLRASPYVQHKIKMEKVVAAHSNYLILRLPQVVGQTQNPHTLLNYIFNRIARSERFQVWTNARRNIIDVEDAARIGASLVGEEDARGKYINVANIVDVAMPDVVELMARVVGKKAICDYINRGDADPIDVQRIRTTAERCGVTFGPQYLEKVFRRYYAERT